MRHLTIPTPTPRIKVPDTAPRGSVVAIKALISHPMETGDRRDDAGALVPRHIIQRFECMFNGQAVFNCELGTGVSANPFFEFDLRLNESGQLDFVWHSDDGSVYRATETIKAT